MKKIVMFLIVIFIVILTFAIPNVLFSIEDFQMEKQKYPKEKIESKINVQAENIYLVKAIHDIENGAFNLKVNEPLEYVTMQNTSTIKKETAIDTNTKKFVTEMQKMKDGNVLENTILDYDDVEFGFKFYGRDYDNLKEKYKINKIEIEEKKTSDWIGAEIEEKTGKILKYYSSSKYNLNNKLSEEEILENYIKYLELYIIDDWRFENNALISEKAKLKASIRYYENSLILCINSFIS